MNEGCWDGPVGKGTCHMNLRVWAWFLDPMQRWNEKSNSTELSLDLHICHSTHVHTRIVYIPLIIVLKLKGSNGFVCPVSVLKSKSKYISIYWPWQSTWNWKRISGAWKYSSVVRSVRVCLRPCIWFLASFMHRKCYCKKQISMLRKWLMARRFTAGAWGPEYVLPAPI